MWERPVHERVLFIVVGLVISCTGAFLVVARNSESILRPILAAASLGLIGLATGVLYSLGITVLAPKDAPTPEHTRMARIARWPLAFAFAASSIWLIATSNT
jgi:hypothetical protein